MFAAQAGPYMEALSTTIRDHSQVTFCLRWISLKPAIVERSLVDFSDKGGRACVACGRGIVSGIVTKCNFSGPLLGFFSCAKALSMGDTLENLFWMFQRNTINWLRILNQEETFDPQLNMMLLLGIRQSTPMDSNFCEEDILVRVNATAWWAGELWRQYSLSIPYCLPFISSWSICLPKLMKMDEE